MDSGRRFLLFFLISKMNGFLYLCLLHFKKKMEQEDFNIREHQLTSRERDFENALRPLSFEDFSGQDKVVENLRIFVKAARLRGEALDHVLLHGPPGLGKTTLSNIIANELGVGFKVTSGPVLDKPGDLAGVLTSLEPNDVHLSTQLGNIVNNNLSTVRRQTAGQQVTDPLRGAGNQRTFAAKIE